METIETKQVTREDLDQFCEALTNHINGLFLRRGDTVNSSRFEPSKGGKAYVRIVRIDAVNGQEISHAGSAHCFVKLDDGTLWKPAGWKGPAKNFPRGSVFDMPTGEDYGR